VDKIKQNEVVEKSLTANLARITDFIKFAETKNGALATLCSAWLVAIVTYIGASKPIPQPIATSIVWAAPFVVVAGATAILSFFPNVNLAALTRLNSTRHDTNLLFFGDIAKIDLDEFEKQVHARYLSDLDHEIPSEYLSDLCIQIAVTSRIAATKFNRFKWALISASVGLFILCVGIARAFVFGGMM
jgi:hypothetical protein